MSLSLISIIAFVFGVLAGAAITAMYKDRKTMEKRLSDLEDANRKLQSAQRQHLPYEKLEQLENLTAALVALRNDRDITDVMLENAFAWAHKLREDKRAK